MSDGKRDSYVQARPRLLKRVGKAIGSYYGIALLISVAGTFAFVELAEEVLEKEFTSMNDSILLAIHAHQSPWLETLAFFFTNLGSGIGITLMSLFMAVALYQKKRFIDLWVFIALIVGAALQVYFLKILFHQIRPRVFNPLAVETSFSFPSGHSLVSFCFWGFVGWWIVEQDHQDWWRWALGIVCLGIAGCVALSRLYLGVHWPTDVLAGAFLAAGWLGACLTGQRWLTRKARAERKKEKGRSSVTSR